MKTNNSSSTTSTETRDAPAAAAIERRELPVQIRADGGADGKPTTISGHAALYNSLSKPMKTSRGTTFRERILPGAFDAALAPGSDVMARYNHQLILGRSTAGTLKLSLDNQGLRYDITPPDSAQADHVVKSVKRGDVKGSSFAFRTVKDKWRMEDGVAVRELVQADLVDVGPVDSPAYGATAEGEAAVSVRSLGTDEAAVDEAVQKLVAETRSGGDGEKRYYYNPAASSLTRALRDCVDNCRGVRDGAAEVLDTFTPQPGYSVPAWGDAEKRAAQDLVDEIADTIAALQQLATKLPPASADGAAGGANSDNSGETRQQQPATAAAAPLQNNLNRQRLAEAR